MASAVSLRVDSEGVGDELGGCGQMVGCVGVAKCFLNVVVSVGATI